MFRFVHQSNQNGTMYYPKTVEQISIDPLEFSCECGSDSIIRNSLKYQCKYQLHISTKKQVHRSYICIYLELRQTALTNNNFGISLLYKEYQTCTNNLLQQFGDEPRIAQSDNTSGNLLSLILASSSSAVASVTASNNHCI